MEAILKFNLNDPDDRMEHMRAVKSLDLVLAIWEFAHNNKKSIEYKIEGMLNKKEEVSPYDAVDMVYESFWEIMDERGLKIDDLIQ